MSEEERLTDLSRRWVPVYAAGLMDGEGHVGISKHPPTRTTRHPRYQLIAAVHMCDREPLEALAAEWGGGIYPARTGHDRYRDTWRWAVASQKAAAFLTDLRPYVLVARMAARIDLGLEFQEQKAPPGGFGRYTPDSYRDTQEGFYLRMRDLNQRGQREAA